MQWRGTEQLQFVAGLVGKRPMPPAGLPIIERAAQLPGLYLAVTHAGVTLAALISRLATAELLYGVDSPLLAPFRPGRLN